MCRRFGEKQARRTKVRSQGEVEREPAHSSEDRSPVMGGRGGRSSERTASAWGWDWGWETPEQKPPIPGAPCWVEPPTLSPWLGAARERVPWASPHSRGRRKGHGRLRLSLQGNPSGTLSRLLQTAWTTWPKPQRGLTNDCSLRNTSIRVKRLLSDRPDFESQSTLMSLSFLMCEMQMITGLLWWKWSED